MSVCFCRKLSGMNLPHLQRTDLLGIMFMLAQVNGYFTFML